MTIQSLFRKLFPWVRPHDPFYEQRAMSLEYLKQFKRDFVTLGFKPDRHALKKAKWLVKELSPPPLVYFTERGSVQLEWETKNEKLYIELEVFAHDIKLFGLASQSDTASMITVEQ